MVTKPDSGPGCARACRHHTQPIYLPGRRAPARQCTRVQDLYASSGDGSPQHLAGLMFTTRTQTELLHVPYKGGAPAINDALAGTVDMLFAVLPEALPHIQSGKLHALGLMAAQRTATLPQTPTMVEAGAPEMNLSAWVGLLAPAKTPQPVIDRLQRAAHAALADPDTRAKLAASGMEVAPVRHCS